ncbi:nuclear transport factor 2 family protein, partial [Rhizobiaceae sp. 2RAB30]
FQDWSEASSQMDLDASMKVIADDIVSFEHDRPLRYFGADAIRAVCKSGFEQMAAIDGAFKWEVDDLRLIPSEDIVVAWGIN